MTRKCSVVWFGALWNITVNTSAEIDTVAVPSGAAVGTDQFPVIDFAKNGPFTVAVTASLSSSTTVP